MLNQKVGIVRELPHYYTQKEHLEKGQLLAEKLREISQLESELASAKKDYTNRITAVEGLATVYSENVRRGHEFRSTECTAWLDYPRPGMKTIIRNDTMEVVGEENMTPADRQMVLQFQREESKKTAAEPEAEKVVVEDNDGEPEEDMPNTEALAGMAQEGGGMLYFPGQHPIEEEQGTEAEEEESEHGEEAETAERAEEGA